MIIQSLMWQAMIWQAGSSYGDNHNENEQNNDLGMGLSTGDEQVFY